MALTEKQKEWQRKATDNYHKNNERIECVFPKGTKERIKALNYKPATFIKEIVLQELEKIEKYNKN